LTARQEQENQPVPVLSPVVDGDQIQDQGLQGNSFRRFRRFRRFRKLRIRQERGFFLILRVFERH
jgi:hypothetical protein